VPRTSKRAVGTASTVGSKHVSAVPATFVFADIAGFTALTEAHGDEEAVTLVDRFSAEVAEVLPR
jgi:class 3 adenylate cyclase